MIEAARRIASERGISIKFDIGDAASLPYENASFDGALCSAQGLMCIPGRERRLRVLREVRRVLSPGSHFVFTTHDRDSRNFAEFWREEADKWSRGETGPSPQ